MSALDKLVDLKRTPAEKKEEAAELSNTPATQPSYGYGLCLHLEDHELEKLGIKNLPKVGAEYHIMAVATVKGVSERDYGERSESGMDLQITMMALSEEAPHAGEDKETAADEKREFKGANSALTNAYRSM